MKSYLKYYLKKIVKKDKNNWSLGLFESISTHFLPKKELIDKINNINLFRPPKEEFWADPFIYNYKGKIFVFFEKFLKKKNKGIISVCELKKNKLINFKDILNENYHLSYPFIFKIKKNIYLIPESYQNKKIQIYKAKKFPFKWIKYKSFFDGEISCDPTIFKYKQNNWMFINKTSKDLKKLNKNLYLYKIVGEFEKLIPHKKNPILSSLFGGRSAGGILKFKNKLIRPAQINKKNSYGFGLLFNKIIKLNINQYKEKKIYHISPKNIKNCIGIHHITKFKNKYIFDLNLSN
jgi:hypothetical protein